MWTNSPGYGSTQGAVGKSGGGGKGWNNNKRKGSGKDWGKSSEKARDKTLARVSGRSGPAPIAGASDITTSLVL